MTDTDRRGACSNREVLLPQKHLNMSFFAVTIMVITTIQWIMLDMYLPALPVLKEEFHTTESMLNITINAGIVSTAISTLFSGTISDRFGRKPVLLTGLIGSAVCIFLCAFSKDVFTMAALVLCSRRRWVPFSSTSVPGIRSSIFSGSRQGSRPSQS